jgi:hypothetical protein
LLATCSAKKDSLVGLLGEGVELGNGVVESLLGEVASTVWAVEDLVAGGEMVRYDFGLPRSRTH